MIQFKYGKGSSGWVRGLVCALAFTVMADVASVGAAESDALVKQIERTFSGVQRRIPTEPSRAETELLEARGLLAQLQEMAPDHSRLAALVKQGNDLTGRLEKRLGRPVGGPAEPVEESPSAGAPKPDTRSALPSAVVTELRRLDSTLDGVVTALEKDQLQSAGTRLDQAKKQMAEIQRRYGGRIPAGNAEMQSATDRLSTTEGRYAEAKAAADAEAESTAAAQRHQEAQSQEWMDQFAPFFDYNSDQVLLVGAAFNRASPADQEKCRQAYARANELMAVYQQTEFPHGKTYELRSMEQSLVGRLRIYNEGAARARQEAASRPWVERLRPYVAVGAGSPKYLIASITLNESEIQEREALLAEAQALWTEVDKEPPGR